MAHIVGAERLWLARLRNEPPTMPVWPDLDLDDLRRRLAALARALDAYLDDSLDDEALERRRRLPQQQGRVLDQHGGGHPDPRERITAPTTAGRSPSAVREAGGEPAYTDFIHAARQGLIG